MPRGCPYLSISFVVSICFVVGTAAAGELQNIISQVGKLQNIEVGKLQNKKTTKEKECKNYKTSL